MLNNLSYKLVILIFLGFLLLLSTAGCISEDEIYEMKTDQEFQQAVDQAVELLLREENDEAVYQNLYELFSNRYPENEIKEYVGKRVNEEREIFSHRVEEIEQQISKLEERVNDYLDQLKDEDEDIFTDIKTGSLKPHFDWIEKLDNKMDVTIDHTRIIELMEEKRNTLDELATILDKKLQSEPDSLNREHLEKRDLINYFYEIEDLLEKDHSITARFDSVSGENYISDRVLYDELKNNIIPESESLLEALIKIKVANEEIVKLHQVYKEGWELQLEGFVLLTEALSLEDDEKIDQANQLIKEGTDLRDKFIEDLNEML